MQLISTASNVGYEEVLRYANQELLNPVGGQLQSGIVAELADWITDEDYFGFIVEMYSDPTSYSGVVFVTKDYQVLYIKDDAVLLANITQAEVETMFTMEPTKGMSSFESISIPLRENTSGVATHTLQIYMVNEYGSNTYYANIINDATTIVEASGCIIAKTTTIQTLGAYNFKVDRLAFNVIEMLSAKKAYTKFQVHIIGSLFESFSYNKPGLKMYVQDTEQSRKSVKLLVKQGVIFASL